MKLCDCAQPDPIGGSWCRACSGVIPLASRGEATVEDWRAYVAGGEHGSIGLDTGPLKGCMRVLVGGLVGMLAVAALRWVAR